MDARTSDGSTSDDDDFQKSPARLNPPARRTPFRRCTSKFWVSSPADVKARAACLIGARHAADDDRPAPASGDNHPVPASGVDDGQNHPTAASDSAADDFVEDVAVDEEVSDEEVKIVKEVYYSTARCSPGVITNLLEVMNGNAKTIIGGLGFTEILKFSCDGIDDRALAMYIMDHIKFDPFRIVIGHKVLPITEQAVHAVIGLPIGGDDLPDFSFGQKKAALAEVRSICESKGMKNICDAVLKENELNVKGGKKKGGKKKGNLNYKRYDQIAKTHVPRWIIERFASMDKDDDWTVQCFFMLLFNALLFPSTSNNISGLDYLYCKNLNDMKNYNWCKALVLDLKEKVNKWQARDKRVAAPIMQGCIAFFIIYYLDNLQCTDMIVDGLTTPRASLFNSELIEKIAKADKKTHRNGSVSYGNLPLRVVAGTCYAEAPADGVHQVHQGAVYQGTRSSSRSAVHARGGLVHRGLVTKTSDRRTKKLATKRPAPPSPAHSDQEAPDAAPVSQNPVPDSTISPEVFMLEPLLAGCFDSLTDEGQKERAISALAAYDKRVAKGSEMMAAATKMFSDGKKEVVDAQKKIVSDMKAIFDQSKPHEDPITTSRNLRAKQGAAGAANTQGGTLAPHPWRTWTTTVAARWRGAASAQSIRALVHGLYGCVDTSDPRPMAPLGHGDPSPFPCFRTAAAAEEAVAAATTSGKHNSTPPPPASPRRAGTL